MDTCRSAGVREAESRLPWTLTPNEKLITWYNAEEIELSFDTLSMTMKKRILFLCTHNSARSQMAEGLLHSLGGNQFEVFSAGTEATFVRPLAIKAMQEIGIDISQQESKTLKRYLKDRFDYVITVCDSANEHIPSDLVVTSGVLHDYLDISKCHPHRV